MLNLQHTGTTCSICRVNHPEPGRRYCRKCHAGYMREWRKTHPLNAEQRHKASCRSYSHTYLRRGRLVREPCVLCGSPDSQMHHPNYDEPLNVIWLCEPCHRAWHL